MSVMIKNLLAVNILNQISEALDEMDKGNVFRAGFKIGRVYEAFSVAMFSQSKEESE